MLINDKYAVDCIIALLCDNKTTFRTPDDYLSTYTYEESRSITLEDLRRVLNDILRGENE